MRARRAAVRKEASKPLPRRGADAFHPRQTILSEPLRPTHPRQTLIQPRAPQEPPKILPALPNIVQLAGSQPERPKLQLTAAELTSLRPKTRASLAASNVAAPEIAALEKQAGAINIASSSQAPAKPLLPVNPMSAPRAAPQKTETNAAAPDIGGRAGANETLIALSATPAPVVLLLRSPPEIFRRAFRFHRTDPSLERPAGLRPARALAEAMRAAQQAMGPKAFSSAAEIMQTPVQLQDWASGRRREKLATRCPRGRFHAHASRPRDRNRYLQMQKGRRSPLRNWDCPRSKCSARNTFTRCT